MPYAVFNYIHELKIFSKDVANICHAGDNEPAVKELMNKPYIKRQLDSLDKGKLISELKEYGAWDAEQLADHEENKMRIVWIAAWNIHEDN